MAVEAGKIFREAWIAGVNKHYPGEPKAGYVAPWDETPEWERHSAAAVYQLIAELLRISEGAARRLTRVQKSQFVAASWTAQIFLRIDNPKPAYVAPWEALPTWQQEVDADIFESIERVEPQAG
ncbi:hypothetical protein BJ973_006657 [Actinoplanes tereljensis]|uniref:Uncharacterized protein n=1 Tax=Paractinoplanes tereljensis TaxID=571912 RepID=A0A919TT13_9ACTN|nr:hypothetical protein [Actinoplanes tereljensis]GIF19612.1 hypothetical protein Ate02nite_23420 [Actinoplanes tereljensis]